MNFIHLRTPVSLSFLDSRGVGFGANVTVEVVVSGDGIHKSKLNELRRSIFLNLDHKNLGHLSGLTECSTQGRSQILEVLEKTYLHWLPSDGIRLLEVSAHFAGEMSIRRQYDL